MSCLGCDLANKILPVHVVFEDEYVCCILDHSPFNEGHVLIMPKRHIRYFDELDEQTSHSVFKATTLITKAIKELYDPDGISVCQNGGAFDELTHLHIHIVPRYEGQSFAEFYIEDEEANVEEETRLRMTSKKMSEAIYSIKPN